MCIRDSVWREFLEDVSSDLGPRSTVIVLGDARTNGRPPACLLYTSDAADDLLCVDLGGRRIIKKKTQIQTTVGD